MYELSAVEKAPTQEKGRIMGEATVTCDRKDEEDLARACWSCGVWVLPPHCSVCSLHRI